MNEFQQYLMNLLKEPENTPKNLNLRLNKLRKIPIDSEMYQSVMGRLI
jgi:hypothetical protein